MFTVNADRPMLFNLFHWILQFYVIRFSSIHGLPLPLLLGKDIYVCCALGCVAVSQAKEESEKRKIADKMIAIKTVLRLTSLRSSVVSLGYEFFKLFIVYQHTRARRELKGLPVRRRRHWKFN